MNDERWRVTLRPLMPSDRPDVEPWLPEAITAIAGVKAPVPDTRFRSALNLDFDALWAGCTVEAVLVEGNGIAGLLVWRWLRSTERGPHPALTVEALMIRAGSRNVGYGAEAVCCLEAMHPNATMFAAIPRSNGLAIYFWLRIGYRPVHVDEDVALAQDAQRLWMVNALSLGASGALSAR
jgi:hypothetical protein